MSQESFEDFFSLSLGDHVLFQESPGSCPQAAIVCHIYPGTRSDCRVNLAVFSPAGTVAPRSHVEYVMPGGIIPSGSFCTLADHAKLSDENAEWERLNKERPDAEAEQGRENVVVPAPGSGGTDPKEALEEAADARDRLPGAAGLLQGGAGGVDAGGPDAVDPVEPERGP